MEKLIQNITLRLSLALCFVFGSGFAFAQQSKIDSLLALLKNDKDDTNKVNHLAQLCDESRKIGEYDKGLKYGNAALDLGNKLPEISTGHTKHQMK